MPEASAGGVVWSRCAQLLAEGSSVAGASVDDDEHDAGRLSGDGEYTTTGMTNGVAGEFGSGGGDFGGDAGGEATDDGGRAYEGRSNSNVGDGVELDRDRLLGVETRGDLRVERVTRDLRTHGHTLHKREVTART